MAIPRNSSYMCSTPTVEEPSKNSNNNNRLDNKMFRPPLMAGTPSYHSYVSPAPAADDGYNHMARKRPRAEAETEAHATSKDRRETSITNRSDRTTSPPPLANTRYSLAGGFDTPTLATAALYDTSGYSECADFRSRWDLGTEARQENDQDGEACEASEGPLARERNGHSRLASGHYQINNERQTNGWGKFVFTLASTVATAVAGKMWSFCRESAFRGFHAGGGKAYEFARPSQLDVDSACDVHSFPSTFVSDRHPRARDFSGDFEQDNTRPPPSKRLHTDTGDGWVFVDRDIEAREASPRLTSRKVSNPLLSSGRCLASRASSRRPLVPVSRRPSSNVACNGSPRYSASHFATLGSPLYSTSHLSRHGATSRASAASTRSPVGHARNSLNTSRPGTADAPSPLTPEAQEYLARKERQEKLNARSMRNMSKKLQDLIKEGNAALATSYNVEAENGHEAFTDGDASDWEDAAADAMLAKF